MRNIKAGVILLAGVTFTGSVIWLMSQSVGEMPSQAQSTIRPTEESQPKIVTAMPALKDTRFPVVDSPLLSTRLVKNLRRRDVLRLELAKSTNLLSFVTANLAAASEHDAESDLAISDALMFCLAWERTQPAIDTVKRQVAIAAIQSDESKERYIQQEERCDSLFLEAKSKKWDSSEWLQRAAADGNGIALYRLSTQNPEHIDGDEQLDLFHLSIESKDPEVLAYIVGAATASGNISDPYITSNPALVDVAVEIAKCSLGVDCSSAGSDYVLGCDNSDCSRAAGIIERYEQQLRPVDMEAARKYSSSLIQKFYGSTYDWTEAKAVEDMIQSNSK